MESLGQLLQEDPGKGTVVTGDDSPVQVIAPEDLPVGQEVVEAGDI